MLSRASLTTLALIAGLPLVASAGQTVHTGTFIQVDYSDAGTWNWNARGRGHRARGASTGTLCDWTYPGSPWQQIGFRYSIGSSSYSYVGGDSSSNYTRVSQSFVNSGGITTVTDVWTGVGVEVTKIEQWRNSSNVQGVRFIVRNIGSSPITNFRIAHAVDPDTPSNSSCSVAFSTVNGHASLYGTSKSDYAYSGSAYMYAGYASCQEGRQDIGHTGSWTENPDVLPSLVFNTADWAMNWRHLGGDIAVGSSLTADFMVGVGTTESTLRSSFAPWRATYCIECDKDGDGFLAIECGGDDCDDNDPDIYPGAPEIPYDGIDQDCSGSDLCDVDGDGFDAGIGECFGVDCNDEDPEIHPKAIEIWYDGIDQNCDGWSDFDQDFDGFDSADHPREDGTVGDDCNDLDQTIHPAAEEIWYDGIDQDCDGWSDFDQDRDGFDSAFHRQPDGSVGDDCDDLDPTVYPGATSLPDGKDNNCDGITDLTDSDGDGIPDEIERLIGTDPHNADSDGDSLSDGFEVGSDWSAPRDSDGDGRIDAMDPDDDGDGIPTLYEVDFAANLVDTDGDGVPDYLDLDSDGDGYPDSVEGYIDTDHNGVPDFRDLDSDGDGILDADEVDGDSDDDNRHDRIDVDDDGDGWSTAEEIAWDPRDFPTAPDYWADVPNWDPFDLDSDGTPNYLDLDTDGDGRLDADEGHGDDDCDGLPNVIDPDDFDGPCMTGLPFNTVQSGACSGASTTAAPAGALGFLLAMLGLAGVRRRR